MPVEIIYTFVIISVVILGRDEVKSLSKNRHLNVGHLRSMNSGTAGGVRNCAWAAWEVVDC